MILYFSSKIFKDKSFEYSKNKNYTYPIVNAKKNFIEERVQELDVLKKSIASFSQIYFKVVIFNLDVEDSIVHDELRIFIQKAFSAADSIIVDFTRPSTVGDWKKKASDLLEEFGDKDPVIIVMNHDHIFVDYQRDVFVDVVRTFMDYPEQNKVLYYSHCAELLSWALNGRGNVRYKRNRDNFFVGSELNHWIDSFIVLNFRTFLNIWRRVNFGGPYIGRIDWPGVRFSDLGLITYIFPREFFRHYDGYYHVTGMRIDGIFKPESDFPILCPAKMTLENKSDFYFQKWLDISFLAVRDYMLKYRNIFGLDKYYFIAILEQTREIFEISVLKNDLKAGIINNSEFEILCYSLHNRIYFDANKIYLEIQTDIQINFRFNIRNLFNTFSFIFRHKFGRGF